MAKILVIEDDEILNDMLSQLLSESGHEVGRAGDGDQGLELLAASPFDLIVTDIVMPEKEGIETILAIRKISKTIPIIAISGGGRVGAGQYLELALGLGADYAFSKPFGTAPFLEAVRECLSGTGPGAA